MNHMDLENQILAWLESHPKRNRRMEDIIEGLGIDDLMGRQVLDQMEQNYEVFRSETGQYQSRKMAGIVEGRISINRAGLGFIDREDAESIRIRDNAQKTALDGDTVLVQCQPWQVYGTVIAVLKRARTHVIGTFEDSGRGLHLVLDDEKLQEKIKRVRYDDDFTPISGMKVVCDIESYGIPMILRVRQVIGYKDDPGVDITSILLDHDIEGEFPDEVMEQVHSISQTVKEKELEGRVNLCDEITVTIDGDDSKDFDDAVSVSRNENGWLLKVSIADVSHYVTEGSPLDQEALKRGCSTYVTDRVVPMLPHELSNGICSLNPHVIRLTLTCQMQVKEDGSISDYRIYPSCIRSTERMTYNNVNRILDGDRKLIAEYEHLGCLFTDLADCADAIRRHRTSKGAIAFNSSESEIRCDKNGHPYYVGPRHSGHAEEMIEDCMIAANVCVANFMKWQEIPSIYRIHDEPSSKRLNDFVRTSELLGHKLILPKNSIRPTVIQNYLESVQDSDEYPVLSTLLLRCMQRAKYDNRCIGHFGLGEEEYLHFTSPIRRYPDLIVHRMLRKYSFEGCMDETQRAMDEQMTAEAAEQSSIRERLSADAEFACADMKKAEYMEDHIGMIAEGIITGVQSYGMYVQLPSTVEGLVRISAMGDDYFVYDQARMQLVANGSRKKYRVGMKVVVMCIGADKKQGNVDFALVGKNGRVYGINRASQYGKRRESTHRKKSERKGYGRKQNRRKNRSA